MSIDTPQSLLEDNSTDLAAATAPVIVALMAERRPPSAPEWSEARVALFVYHQLLFAGEELLHDDKLRDYTSHSDGVLVTATRGDDGPGDIRLGVFLEVGSLNDPLDHPRLLGPAD